MYARVCLCSFIWTCLQTQERDEIAAVKATTCCISSSPLQDHVAAGAAGIVCCELGFLYSKEALLAHIVEKKVPEKFSHVKSMKDVTEVKLTLKSQEGADNRHGATATAAGGMIYQEAPFQCPVTSRDMNGFNRFCVIRCSGAAVSLDAIKQLSCCPEADGSILCPLPIDRSAVCCCLPAASLQQSTNMNSSPATGRPPHAHPPVTDSSACS
eukprot:COSAG01_NODE_11321_length_1959_cov_1.694624_3_plen_212_part_00